jgi:ABC-2 type transport system ATP-binding protein
VDVVLDYRSAAVKTGYAPEIPPLFPDMTAEDYLGFVANLKGIKKSERTNHVVTIMEMIQIADVRKRLLKNLSKGYRQRVGIAQALIGFPPVLILDEPTAGLDPSQIHQLRELLRSFAGKHTVILSSHILSEISNLCDEVIIINNGKVTALESIKKQAGKGSVFVLTVNTVDTVKALACVRAVPGIAEAEPVKKTDTTVTIKLRFDSGLGDAAEVKSALFYELSAAKLPILELARDRENLEELYLRATVGGES